jgi:hypothetical protein
MDDFLHRPLRRHTGRPFYSKQIVHLSHFRAEYPKNLVVFKTKCIFAVENFKKEDMIQVVIPGIVMCVMGLCLLFVSADKIWTIAEKWKTVGGERPSKSYVFITRVLGIVFIIVGGGLLVSSLI